jgi:alkanesulfonate monooxygenase SsuD/methylene tetrahydromethanopterin reductase-like flavin-dependent oxidoreductase (luciferase family)
MMTDYGRPLQFGYFLVPDAANHAQLIQLAQQLESWGLDLIGIQDHPYQPRFLDTWTLMAMIAAQTKRIRIFPDVASLPLRPPGVMAKAAASLDLLSGGRFELGIGAGAFWDAIVAMGGPLRAPREAVAALEEAIAVIRHMWSGERSVKFVGEYYSLNGTHPGPVPAHPINIWVGAYGPKMLNLIGRVADGWVPSLAYTALPKITEMQQRIDDAAASAGRDPAAIYRILNISGRITDGDSSGLLNGPVNQWVDDLTTLSLEYGMDSYVLMENDLAQVRRFAEEIAPQVRERVAQHRGTATVG